MVTASAGSSVATAALTTDPALAADYAARWLVDQAAGNGGFGTNEATVDAVLAFAAAGSGDSAFAGAMEYLRDQGSVIAASDDPALIGKTILAAVFAGDDPTNFRGADLVAAIIDSMHASAPDAGLFGSADPSTDGVARQGLALLGLNAAGVTPPPEAVSWLVGQQCASGGWPAYRADTATPCPDPEFALIGEDTRSTSYATQALAAVGTTPTSSPLDWLDSIQNSDGSFGIYTNDPTDAVSTGLSAQAIIAGGEDPGAGRWLEGAASPLTVLAGLQVGCEGPAANRGAIQYNSVAGTVDVSITAQAVPGAAGQAFPLAAGTVGGSVDWPACPEPPTTTTTPGGPPGPGPNGGGTATTAVAAGELPATGANGAGGLSTGELGLLGFGLLAAGVALVGQHRRRIASS